MVRHREGDLCAGGRRRRRPGAPAGRAGAGPQDKLGGPPHERRYSAPSYVIDGVVVPGYNPVEAYETAIANRAPTLTRRAKPASVAELLTWADEPLATAEIALVIQIDPERAREDLRAAHADWRPVGADGYWMLGSRPGA